MTINSTYKKIVSQLSDQFSIIESKAMADRLIWHYCGFSRVDRVIKESDDIEVEHLQSIDSAVKCLLAHVPLQYILGTTTFLDFEFKVSPSVLIPRPETEELVILVYEWLRNRNYASGQILDIGTGSGCISVSLAKKLPNACVTAIDISNEALQIAKQNALLNEVNVLFKQLDILNELDWKEIKEFDVIVSNPPYVTETDKKEMQPNVLDHEPALALYVSDDDPLVFYRKIAEFCNHRLTNQGLCALEINEAYGNEVCSLFLPNLYDLQLINDMQNKPRFVLAQKKESS